MNNRALAAKITGGDVLTASRLIRDLEDRVPGARDILKSIYPNTGNAHVIGITGAPGSGKSTITDALIDSYRKDGKTVGVLAVDPTSPFSGGAILGDRIRMQRHSEDQDVFIRSLATRGYLGGLSPATGDAIRVMDAMGKNIILIETVGTGQQEVEIINHAHTVVVILVPGMGDEVQALKAGIMEIADIFVINKADRDGTHQMRSIVSATLDLAEKFPGNWRPPIIEIGNLDDPIPFRNQVGAVRKASDEHFRMISNSDVGQSRFKRKAILEIDQALRATLLEPVIRNLTVTGEYETMIERVMKKELDPYSIAEEISVRHLKQSTP